jgi:hypothetical protein
MKSIQTLLLVFLSHFLFSQKPKVEWAKTYGGIYSDIARGVVVTPENDYIVVGTALSENFDDTDGKGFADAWVMKISKDGQQLWKKSYGGTNDDVANTINPTADGGYLIGGETASNDGDVKVNKGKFDAWLFKIDKNGTLLWEKTFGGSDDDYKGDAFETKNGNIILGIVSKSNDGDFVGINGKEDCWFLKLDRQGNVLWKKEFGGSNSDNTRSIKPIDDKTFVAVGRTESIDGNFLNNTQGDFILKMDTDGNFIWVKSFTTYNGFIYTLMGFEAVTILSDNTIAAVGFEHRPFTRVDLFLIKCDTSGKELMKKFFGGNGFDSGQDVKALPDGGMIILGTTNSTDSISKKSNDSDIWLLKLDKDGNTVWNKLLGGSKEEFSGDCVIAHDNSILVVGETESSDSIFNKNNGREDWAIIKVKDDIRNSIQNSDYTDRISVFPNPTDGFINIRLNDIDNPHIALIDLSGRLIREYKIAPIKDVLRLDLSDIKNGTYILSIKSMNQIYNQKIVILK